jgi:HSP90 family molecular chaperone
MTADSTTQRVPLEFAPDIVTLLTDQLYPQPKEALREILANACDALTTARAGGQIPEGIKLRILVTMDRADRTLVIDDNGCGIPRTEALTLNRVGAQDKRERFETHLKDMQVESSEIKKRLNEVIGRWGIGRLAARTIADKVVVSSRPRNAPEGDDGLEWAMEGNDNHTTYREIVRSNHGTRVTLQIKEELADTFLDMEELEAILKEYTILLPFPVRLGSEVAPPINVMDPVIYRNLADSEPVRWVHPSKRTEQGGTPTQIDFQELWDTIYGELPVKPPITILPLLPSSKDGGELVRGLLFIPSDPQFPEMGRIRLWAKRMFVRSNEEDLLPTWARPFVSGVIDCHADPNLARSDLLRTEQNRYSALKQEIERQLILHLGILPTQGAEWDLILALHRPALVSAASVHPDLLRAVGDHITFRQAVSVSEPGASADIKLKKYVEYMPRRRGIESELPQNVQLGEGEELTGRLRKTLFYYNGESSLSGVIDKHTVLHASTPFEVAFLQAYCSHKGLEHMNVGHQLPYEPVEGFQNFAETVRAAVGTDADKRDLEIRPVRLLSKRDVPCLLTVEDPRGLRREYHIRRINEMPDEMFAEMANQFREMRVKPTRAQLTEMLAEHAMEEEHKDLPPGQADEMRLRQVLFLNMSNDLMLQLALDENFQGIDEKRFRNAALHECWHAAKLARGEPIVHPNTEHFFDTATRFLDLVIRDVYLPGRQAQIELQRRSQETPES